MVKRCITRRDATQANQISHSIHWVNVRLLLLVRAWQPTALMSSLPLIWSVRVSPRRQLRIFMDSQYGRISTYVNWHLESGRDIPTMKFWQEMRNWSHNGGPILLRMLLLVERPLANYGTAVLMRLETGKRSTRKLASYG